MIKESYNFIWTVLIKAKNQKIDANMVKFKVSKKVSPYLELNVEDINFDELEQEDGKYIVEVNPYIRFSDSFMYLFNIKYSKAKKFKDSLANIYFHIMGNLDLFDGRSCREYQLEFILKEIEEGKFGNKISKLFFNFTETEKYNISEVLYDLYKFENRMEAYKRVVQKVFFGSIIYDNSFSKAELVIYISNDDNKSNILKLKCIDMLFLPIGLKTRVFWKYHFGIIGLPLTNKIGNIAIY